MCVLEKDFGIQSTELVIGFIFTRYRNWSRDCEHISICSGKGHCDQWTIMGCCRKKNQETGRYRYAFIFDCETGMLWRPVRPTSFLSLWKVFPAEKNLAAASAMALTVMPKYFQIFCKQTSIILCFNETIKTKITKCEESAKKWVSSWRIIM